MRQDKPYKFIDLFAGCGGMSLGFEMAGYRNIVAIDFWQDALTTYEHNRENAQTLCADLASLEPSYVKKHYDVESVDVIIGGPPCQGFSIAGKRIIDDERNRLYKSFVNFVKFFRPKAFVMENVPNILSIGEGAVKHAIVHDFSSLGYTLTYQILTASDFGVPQNRRRAFFVGIKDGKEFIFPNATFDNPVTSKEALSDLPEGSIADGSFYPTESESDFQIKMRDGSHGVYNHEITVHTEQTKNIIAMVPDGGNYKDLPKELWSTRKVHNSSEAKSYKQIGNAIPPVLMWHIAKSMQDLANLNGEDLPSIDEASQYFVTQILDSNAKSFNYEYNPFTGTLFNEPTAPYGTPHTY